MTTPELIAEVRRRLRDTVGAVSQRLWSDDELVGYANAARDRFFLICRRLVVDSTTAADNSSLPLCSLSVVAGTAKYALSPKIIEIARVKLASQYGPLDCVLQDELDLLCPNWQGADPNTPWAYCPDLDTDSITLIPTPVANDTAQLTVYRFPLVLLSATNEDLGFRREYHEELIPWVLHLAFSKKDAETDNPEMSAYFQKEFLERTDEIRLEIHRRLSNVHTNRPRRAFLAR